MFRHLSAIYPDILCHMSSGILSVMPSDILREFSDILFHILSDIYVDFMHMLFFLRCSLGFYSDILSRLLSGISSDIHNLFRVFFWLYPTESPAFAMDYFLAIYPTLYQPCILIDFDILSGLLSGILFILFPHSFDMHFTWHSVSPVRVWQDPDCQRTVASWR